MNKKLNFEEAQARLQQIVETLEKGEVPLADSLKLFEEGAGLSTFCYESLRNAEQKITEINVQILERENENK